MASLNNGVPISQTHYIVRHLEHSIEVSDHTQDTIVETHDEGAVE